MVDLNQQDNFIDELLLEIKGEKRNVLLLLQKIQDHYNYLPKSVLKKLYQKTHIAPRQIESVSTFFNHFRHEPAGEFFIKVCIGTACHVKGANALYEDFKKHLNIPQENDTDSSNLFTVEKVACLGCCMIAPAVQIDDLTYGFVTREKIPQIINDFLLSKKTTYKNKHTSPLPPSATEQGVVKICLCSSCQASGSLLVMKEIETLQLEYNLPLKIKTVSCSGESFNAPTVKIDMATNISFSYGKVKTDQVQQILFSHFSSTDRWKRLSKQVENFLLNLVSPPLQEPIIRYITGHSSKNTTVSSSKEVKIATHGGGDSSPLDFNGYIQDGGFKAFQKVQSYSSKEVIEGLKKSGLRGRGGAGFPTYKKWGAVFSNPSKIKYLICNGDEGDPGAFMDRMLLESFPFRVIEGMLIASYVCGIKEAYIFIRNEYPLAIKRLKKAIKRCEEEGFISKTITSKSGLHIELVVSAGAFVCGEETALIKTIEGNRGTPTHRPPFPSEKGLWGFPTLVNNVETLSLIPHIISNLNPLFHTIGPSHSRGTKTFALAGKINNGGLIEVEMGTPLLTIIEDIGGGVPNEKTLKAVLIGGPAGGCIPKERLKLPIDYESLKNHGAIMGSGGMVVLDEDDCIVDIIKYFMAFSKDESCGKCTFCRIGTLRLFEMLDNLSKGLGDRVSLDKLKELATQVKESSLCGLGKSAPNPLLSALKYFEEEFLAHINQCCTAGKCKDLIYFQINHQCVGCTKCNQACPVEAISGSPYQNHQIDQETCIKCNQCFEICPVQAVEKVSKKEYDENH